MKNEMFPDARAPNCQYLDNTYVYDFNRQETTADKLQELRSEFEFLLKKEDYFFVCSLCLFYIG